MSGICRRCGRSHTGEVWCPHCSAAVDPGSPEATRAAAEGRNVDGRCDVSDCECTGWSGAYALPPCRLVGVGDGEELGLRTCAICPNAPPDTPLACIASPFPRPRVSRGYPLSADEQAAVDRVAGGERVDLRQYEHHMPATMGAATRPTPRQIVLERMRHTAAGAIGAQVLHDVQVSTWPVDDLTERLAVKLTTDVLAHKRMDGEATVLVGESRVPTSPWQAFKQRLCDRGIPLVERWFPPRFHVVRHERRIEFADYVKFPENDMVYPPELGQPVVYQTCKVSDA